MFWTLKFWLWYMLNFKWWNFVLDFLFRWSSNTNLVHPICWIHTCLILRHRLLKFHFRFLLQWYITMGHPIHRYCYCCSKLGDSSGHLGNIQTFLTLKIFEFLNYNFWIFTSYFLQWSFYNMVRVAHVLHVTDSWV